MIDPRALKTFLAVCRQGSISAAARWLNISQPSVSVTIAQLEAGLAGSLFERGRLGITLTPAGQALRRRAEMMETLLSEASEAVALALRGVRGPLRIGGTPGALVSLVPAAIAAIERDERMALTVIEAADARLTDLLRRGEIEVAIVTTALDPTPEDIEERSILRDPFSLIVGSAHADIGSTISLRDVAGSGWGWVLPQAAGAFHRQIDALFIAAERPLPVDVIRCDSLLTSKAIVRRGSRVTILPRGIVADELVMGTLRAVAIAEASMTRTIGIRTVAGRTLSPLADQFVAAVSAVYEI